MDTIEKEQIEEKVKYEKPLFEECKEMKFTEEIWEKFTNGDKSCMQCSGCHGCR